MAVAGAYLSYVFQFGRGTFWTSGMGDWIDPYFINGLLEHWYYSAWRMRDPSSPPMYFPVHGTLGYSHGLILYAPFYVAVRPFLHPFAAYNLTLFLVILTGIGALYAVLRRFLRLSFVESLLLTAFFFTSRNVVNGGTGVWSQRASVFLIPPILLILLAAAEMPRGLPKLAVAWLSGLLSALLFTQDFYTGYFVLLLTMLILPAPLLLAREPPVSQRILNFWSTERHAGTRLVLIAAILATAWAIYVWLYGGTTVEVLGVRITSHNWRRPALLALAALLGFVWLRGASRLTIRVAAPAPWVVACAFGVVAGLLVFFWIYLGAYREHHAFPPDQLILTVRDSSRWRGPLDLVSDLQAYDTVRPFALVLLVTALAWAPWSNVDRKARLHGAWFLFVSLIVLAVPLRLGDFSIWRSVLAPLPGASVIRDPRRIIYVYELAVVLATALLLARLPSRSVIRHAIALVVFSLLLAGRNPEVFDFLRPSHSFDRWVQAPIEIDDSCRSFFITGASAEYMSRSPHMFALYGVDSTFVALKHSIPTLNGYSAWTPAGWDLANPQKAGYADAVERWIERHGLGGVCELDIDTRTMRPHRTKVARE